MQDKDIQALKALAEKATQEEWQRDGRAIYSLQHAGWRKGEEQFENRFYCGVQHGRGTPESELEANAAFIVAAQPRSILSLIASHEQQAERIAQLEAILKARDEELTRMALSTTNITTQRPAVDLSGLTRYGFCDFDDDKLIERPDGEFVKLSGAQALLDAGDTCATCSGRGEVGGFEGGVAPGFVSYPCPDCSTSAVREESNTEWAARHLMPFKGRDTSAVRGVGLTDERITEISRAHRNANGMLLMDISFARAIERELLSTANAAQEGVSEAAAWMTEDGQRVVTARTMDGAKRDGGVMVTSMEPYKVKLVRDDATPSPSVNSKEGGNGVSDE